MGRWIDHDWIEKVNPVRAADLARLRREVERLFGKNGSVVVVRGRGSIPSEVEVRVCGVGVGSREMRHVDGDVLDIVKDLREVTRDMREALSSSKQEVEWAKQSLRAARKRVAEQSRALAVVRNRRDNPIS